MNAKTKKPIRVKGYAMTIEGPGFSGLVAEFESNDPAAARALLEGLADAYVVPPMAPEDQRTLAKALNVAPLPKARGSRRNPKKRRRVEEDEQYGEAPGDHPRGQR